MPLHTCFDTCQVFTISKFHPSHRCVRTVIVMADTDQDFPKTRGSFYVQVLLSSPAFWSQIWFASAKYTLISLPTCAKQQRMWQIESAISLSRPGAVFEWDVKTNATLPALEPQNRNVIGKIDHLQLAFLVYCKPPWPIHGVVYFPETLINCQNPTHLGENLARIGNLQSDTWHFQIKHPICGRPGKDDAHPIPTWTSIVGHRPGRGTCTR